MNRRCQDCNQVYDDARASTICPHTELMPRHDMDRKIAAIELMDKAQGKYLRFRGQAEGRYRLQAVSWDGMITVDGFSGEFAPHLFEVVE